MECLANKVMKEKGYKFKIKSDQLRIITSIIDKRDTFAVLPTGYGKSMCYILPPLIMDCMHSNTSHASLVISPLKAIIKDQVTALRDHNIKAYGIYEGTENTEIAEMKAGNATVLLASPEAITTKYWRRVLDDTYKGKLCVVAYDEAHCITEWGLDFRPDYRKVGVIQSIVDCPVLAVTATATTEMLNDISTVLGLDNANVIASLPNRENIQLCVHKSTENFEQELTWLLNGIATSKMKFPKTIIYVNSISMCEKIYIWIHTSLQDMAYHGEKNVSNRLVEMYHAHTDLASKNRILTNFVQSGCTLRILIGTVAVGMGIDIPDITMVVVWGLPPSIPQFWQEAGRGGRDGRQAICICFAYPRSIALPCDNCRKAVKRICTCTNRTYTRNIVTTSQCQRVYCLTPFSINTDSDRALECLRMRNSNGKCNNACEKNCLCANCLCCINCMLHCTCPANHASKDELIKSYLTTS